VGFSGADVYDPLGLTGVRVSNFLISSIFSLFLFCSDFTLVSRSKMDKRYLPRPHLTAPAWLRHGSGSATLDISTLYVNVVASAMSNYSPSTLFLLFCRSRSRIMIKLRLHQIDSLWLQLRLRLRNSVSVYMKKRSRGAIMIFMVMFPNQSRNEHYLWILSLILRWLLGLILGLRGCFGALY
jgi:hypothetical protein